MRWHAPYPALSPRAPPITIAPLLSRYAAGRVRGRARARQGACAAERVRGRARARQGVRGRARAARRARGARTSISYQVGPKRLHTLYAILEH